MLETTETEETFEECIERGNQMIQGRWTVRKTRRLNCSSKG